MQEENHMHEKTQIMHEEKGFVSSFSFNRLLTDVGCTQNYCARVKLITHL